SWCCSYTSFAADCQEEAAGFCLSRIIPTEMIGSVIEAVPDWRESRVEPAQDRPPLGPAAKIGAVAELIDAPNEPTRRDPLLASGEEVQPDVARVIGEALSELGQLTHPIVDDSARGDFEERL